MSTTISGTSGVTFPDSTSMQTGQQACKAWINFNGTGTVAIRGSYNVSSITDNGTGDFYVNFTNAMPDANYSTFGSLVGGYGIESTAGIFQDGFSAQTTSSVHVNCQRTDNQTIQDYQVNNVAIFSN